MSRELLTQDLKLHVFPSGRVRPQDVSLHNDVYKFWHNSWHKTFKELDQIDRLHSDDFKRQDEKICFTHGSEVIGFFAFSWFDLRLESEVGHSYFSSFPADAIEFLKHECDGMIMTMGQLTVAPKWRKSEIGPIITEALLWQGYARFLDSDTDLLVAFTRNDRKINTLCYNYGSRCLREKMIGHNVEVDLIWTKKTDVKPNMNPEIRHTAAQLWENRSVHSGVDVISRKMPGNVFDIRRVA